MAFGMLNSNTLPIAVEFGVGSLKALQLAPGDPPSLVAAACLDTPEELRRDHDARLAFQCEHVVKLLKSSGFKGRRVICSIPAPFTLVQHIQLQKSDGVNLTDQVMAHLQSQLNCDPKRVVVRHIDVGAINKGGGSRSEVICFAVARDMVMRIMTAMKAGKYEVVGAHSEHVALARAFDHVTRRASDEDLTSVYLDLGAGATKIIITHGRETVFAKTIHVAGADLDASVARAMSCELAEARARRLTMGRNMPEPVKQRSAAAAQARSTVHRIGAPEEPAESATMLAEDRRTGEPAPGMTPKLSDRSDADIEACLEAPVDALTTEISMCLRYHERQFPEHQIGRAIFVGGESRDLSLCQRIARSLRLPAQIADPLACVRKTGKEPMRDIDLSSPQPGWVVPFGLCFSPKNL